MRIIWAAAIVLAATVGVYAQDGAPAASEPTTTAAPMPADTTATPTPPAPLPDAVAPAPAKPAEPLSMASVKRGIVARLGSMDPKSGYNFQITLTHWGAGLQDVTLSKFYTDTSHTNHYTLVAPLEVGNLRMYTLAAREVVINNHAFNLETVAWDLMPGNGISQAHYRAVILGPDGGRLLQIDRIFRIAPDSYSLTCEQRLTNLATGPIKVTWKQYGHGDVTGDMGYLGDRRELVGGYHDLDYNPKASVVYTNDLFLGRLEYLKEMTPATTFWPHPNIDQQAQLVWAASINRYFISALYRPVEGTGDTAKRQPLSDVYPVIGQFVLGDAVRPEHQAMAFTLATDSLTLKPGEDTGDTLDLALYLGPREKQTVEQPPYSTLQFNHLVVYQLGCTWCTFQFLARGLLWFLRLIEGDIIFIGGVGIGLHDWGLSIIVLVLVVRLILHPITKSSQIRMAKMGRQMKALQPELIKLKEKYKNDQQAYNREMMRLYRERNVSPFNMLGCLPMVLQMPIWVALYAMLYYAIEIRQESAFYGLFQAVGGMFGMNWQFLADLSQPDHFFRIFSEPRPLQLFIINFDYQYLNILPLLMGLTFFFQQRITMANNMGNQDGPKTEQQLQQEQTQKIMMWMMPILFPVMMYSVPSGLTLYIMASTLAGIIDSAIVRKHIREEEAAGTLLVNKPKVPPKPGTLAWRVQQGMQSFAAKMNQAQEQNPTPRPGGGREERRQRRDR